MLQCWLERKGVIWFQINLHACIVWRNPVYIIQKYLRDVSAVHQSIAVGADIRIAVCHTWSLEFSHITPDQTAPEYIGTLKNSQYMCIKW